ncbi:NAD-dependent protein deacylase [Dielma fastidiosa]|uniref:NAD-dependent protein deacetylase n=1 Tax=Dielma fastidiosa TaxID=1034346 RepID=A0AB35UP05_9FIRM|nr:NAD-dependent protein deacylase [Dielma fastidiosa]MDY5168706.1 NAD-dependent protein deacylase [Dielma fastidiosa]
MSKIEELAESLKKKHIVFFGGAGVSTESNIPDFRSSDGLYQKKTYKYPAERMLSHSMYEYDPKAFYDFYFNEMIYPNAIPNAAHEVLAKLEAMGNLDAIITQNIDGLHQAAGSKHVYELHGSVHRNTCQQCGAHYSLNEMLKQKGQIPRCACGGIIKPDVVLYEEGLDAQILRGAISAINNADVLIVGGTSLVVYPAAGLLDYFHGSQLILINKDATAYDSRADLIFNESIAKVLSEAMELIENA